MIESSFCVCKVWFWSDYIHTQEERVSNVWHSAHIPVEVIAISVYWRWKRICVCDMIRSALHPPLMHVGHGVGNMLWDMTVCSSLALCQCSCFYECKPQLVLKKIKRDMSAKTNQDRIWCRSSLWFHTYLSADVEQAALHITPRSLLPKGLSILFLFVFCFFGGGLQYCQKSNYTVTA